MTISPEFSRFFDVAAIKYRDDFIRVPADSYFWIKTDLKSGVYQYKISASGIVFLHEVIAGAADRSYGIQVAKGAGLPPAVIDCAKHILSEPETADRERPVRRLVDDLPLFAHKPRPSAGNERQPKDGPLRVALAALTPDEMSPREALEALYRLREIE